MSERERAYITFRDCRRRLNECLGEPADAILLDALRGAINLRDAIVGAVRSALEDESAASRLRGRLDAMEARLRGIERRAEGKREMALRAMEEADLELLETADLRITVRHAPPLLLIDDESCVLDAYRVVVAPRIDYSAIRDALRSGGLVPGAALAEAETYLSVHTS